MSNYDGVHAGVVFDATAVVLDAATFGLPSHHGLKIPEVSSTLFIFTFSKSVSANKIDNFHYAMQDVNSMFQKQPLKYHLFFYDFCYWMNAWFMVVLVADHFFGWSDCRVLKTMYWSALGYYFYSNCHSLQVPFFHQCFKQFESRAKNVSIVFTGQLRMPCGCGGTP